ncbi:LpqB family beta-propeller domain-containing protein [Microbacterium sp. B2969]|uniref:LpqB family beta-propeller domain-containing protein n=1 Tax=Microbacterium alkaliflavum TaxID=3248839 RepID=A0ABW7Q7E0_9MICO
MRRLRSGLAAVVAAVTLALAGCAGLPTSGSVQPGLPADADAGSPDFALLPDSPQPGASPQEIVDGFVRAGTGPGPDGSWAVAKEYLTPAEARRWDPTANVTIDEPGLRGFSSSAEDQVSVTTTPVATIDEIGAYSPSVEGPTTLPFQLAKQSDGEWRISKAPDGLLLDTSQFSNVFHRYALMYFDPTWQFLVPDVRWFPATNAPTYIADALVNGPPAPWLAASVATAFPEDVSASPSVPVDSGVAQVELSTAAIQLGTDTLSRMQAQLAESLQTASGVSDVQMAAGTTPLEVEPAPVRSTRVSNQAAVLTQDGFGFLTGNQLQPIPGLTPAMTQVDPVSIQLSPDRDFAAARLDGGAVARVSADDGLVVYDQRPGLIDPTVDPSGYTWSVPGDAPSQLTAFAPGHDPIHIAEAWPEATQVSAMSLSRDGTRLAAVVTSGGRPSVWVSGVVRDTKGVPSALGEPLLLQLLSGSGIAVSWLDDSTIAVLASAGDDAEVVDLTVGGPSATTPAPAGAAQLAGINNGNMRVKGVSGELYSKRGSTWPQTAVGIFVLATQQGSPR